MSDDTSKSKESFEPVHTNKMGGSPFTGVVGWIDDRDKHIYRHTYIRRNKHTHRDNQIHRETAAHTEESYIISGWAH